MTDEPAAEFETLTTPQIDPESIDWQHRTCPFSPVVAFKPVSTLLQKPGEVTMEPVKMPCDGPVCMAWRDGDCSKVAEGVALEAIAIEYMARTEAGI